MEAMHPEHPHAQQRGWLWVPSVYFLEALPYNLAHVFALAYFTLRGVSVDQVALWTSLLGLPWVLKCLWSPWLERFRRPGMAICALQAAMGAVLIVLACCVENAHWFAISIFLLAALGLCSATHDCVADGFYIRRLPENVQAFFSGIRNTFYRLGMLAAGGGLIICYGYLKDISVFEEKPHAPWMAAFALAAVVFLLGAAYHLIALPRRASAPSCQDPQVNRMSYWQVVSTFLRKPAIGRMILFVLLYRFAESFLLKITPIFMLAQRDEGGLGLTEVQYGTVYGTFGMIALLCGGILGGWLISRIGLKRCFWPMAVAINVPDVLYVYLAAAQPENIHVVASCVLVEQFGYGFGFTAFMVYLLYMARGAYPTAHYAICTALMALGVLVPGALSGFLARAMGFTSFFVLACVATVLSFLAVRIAPLAGDFGRRDG